MRFTRLSFLFQIIESRLKMALPEDLASALTDGVVLCHLANHIKPRSVASIHVPSPAVVSVHCFSAKPFEFKVPSNINQARFYSVMSHFSRFIGQSN